MSDISLTESAAQRVRDYLDRRGHGLGLRLGVRRTGCSGWSYVLDYADEAGEDDLVFEDRGVAVVVDRESLPLLAGVCVDFVREGLNETFRFENPNAESECGCGESFNAAADAPGAAGSAAKDPA